MSTDWSSVWLPVTDPCERIAWGSVFRRRLPVHLDLGAGDGGFALAFAETHPGVNMVAVERLLGRLRKIVRRGDRAGLANLRAVRMESAYFVRYLVPPASVDVIHVMHPDPWPRKRQEGRRLFQPEFVAACAAALRPGGELRVTTDHPAYFRVILDVVGACELLREEPWRPGAGYPRSDFERQFAAEGKVVGRARWLRGEAVRPSGGANCRWERTRI
jgi:tRNA (guanine-N7-)-methyltransferase